MNALIVGADRVGTLCDELLTGAGLRFGIRRCSHWSGRNVGDSRRALPEDTRLVVVVCDRVSHGLLNNVRKQAGKKGVPVIYVRHSLLELRDKLMGWAEAA